MVASGEFFRRSVALSLFGQNMHQHRMIDLLCLPDHLLHRLDIVTVHRSQVGNAHIFKQHAGNQQLLDGIFGLLQLLHQSIADHRNGAQEGADRKLQLIVALIRTNAVQISGHAADIFRNGHIVVVQHDDEILLHAGSIVQTLIGHAAGQGAVSDHGNHCEFLVLNVPCLRDAQSCRNRCGAVSGIKAVKGALRTLREAAHAAVLPKAVEIVLSPGENLVGIGLMPHIPHDLIRRQIQGQIQPDGQLHHTQVRCQMSPIL